MQGFSTVPRVLAAATESPRYALYCRLFAIGSFVHLALANALEDGWLAPNLIYAAGATLLAVQGSVAAWTLCAVGLAWPLLFLGDQLTQSLYLLLQALLALALHLGAADGRSRRLAVTLPFGVRLLTATLYALAAFHKLNTAYFDPETSCAAAGARILGDNWAFDVPSSLLAAAPPVFLAVEASVPVWLYRRPLVGIAIALAMHIPLTIVFDPAFAFLMLPGFACFLGEREIVLLRGFLGRRWVHVSLGGVALGLASFAAYLVRHHVVYPLWQIKEVVLWIALVGCLLAIAARPRLWLRAPRREVDPPLRGLAIACFALFALKGFTPYTGLWVHHSGAMLSGLRIDDPCWNSLVVPRAVRLDDPYLRFDEAIGDEPLASALRARLFTPRSLRALRDASCPAHVSLRGTYRGAPIVIDDLCAAPLPTEALDTLKRYQDNLERDCHQACIH